MAAHYRDLSVEELMRSVLAHYEAMWPGLIAPLIARHLDSRSGPPLVLEGSALLPGHVIGQLGPRVAALWLTAPDALLRERILSGSDYPEMDAAQQRLVEKFLDRTLAFNAFIGKEIARYRLPSFAVSDAMSEAEMVQRCGAVLGPAAL